MKTQSVASFLTRVLLVLALPMAASLPAQAADAPVLKVGIEGAYPPFSSVGPDGQLKGFDIDIALAVCAHMKAQCKLVQQDFDGMIPSLNAKKLDLLVASMSITPERLKVVDFSDKYYNTPNRIIAKTGAPFDGTAGSFKGKRVGVQRSLDSDLAARVSRPEVQAGDLALRARRAASQQVMVRAHAQASATGSGAITGRRRRT